MYQQGKHYAEAKTILVVEDEEINFMFIEEVLEDRNINLVHAFNGHEAIEVCKTRNDIDLILMDMKMPLMDGFEATRHIKKFRPNLPIIAQTALAMAGDKDLSLEAGCDDYISKPINVEEIVTLVDKYLLS